MTAAALAMALAAAAPQGAAGFDTAVTAAIGACQLWLLDPASWTNGIDAFTRRTRLIPQPRIPDIALPPPSLRQALHHWRAPAGPGGVFVTTSDRLPACHLSGGGPFDAQPDVEAALARPGFGAAWRRTGQTVRGDVISTTFASAADPALTLIVSRARAWEMRTDRPQFTATARYAAGPLSGQ